MDEEDWVEIPRTEYALLNEKLAQVTDERDKLLLMVENLSIKLDKVRRRLDAIDAQREANKWKGE